MRRLGYTRVSTTSQDARLQLDALRGVGVEGRDVFSDVTSGNRAAIKRPGMKKLLEYAEDGDTVVVWRIDRLGRSLIDVLNTVNLLRERGVKVRSISDGIVETCRRRTPWLAVNLLTAIMASWVISLFSNSIQAIVALATLMPIVASQGGNAATQTLAVAVRGLATKDLTPSNAGRIIVRELMVGGLNGLIFALVMGATTVFWFGSPLLALVMAMAMIINLLAAALGGILIPLAIEKLGFDPALASGAFVTTVTDVVGFFSFLGLATLILL